MERTVEVFSKPKAFSDVVSRRGLYGCNLNAM